MLFDQTFTYVLLEVRKNVRIYVDVCLSGAEVSPETASQSASSSSMNLTVAVVPGASLVDLNIQGVSELSVTRYVRGRAGLVAWC